VADGMLGKLSRWLRILGCDVDYRRNESDENLVTTAKRSEGILLTSDLQLYRQAVKKDVNTFFVSGKNEAEMLSKISKKFKVKFQFDGKASRCPICNTPLREASFRDVEGKIPSSTYRKHCKFWSCTNPSCQKLYWRGTHWIRIEEVLREAEAYLK